MRRGTVSSDPRRHWWWTDPRRTYRAAKGPETRLAATACCSLKHYFGCTKQVEKLFPSIDVHPYTKSPEGLTTPPLYAPRSAS